MDRSFISVVICLVNLKGIEKSPFIYPTIYWQYGSSREETVKIERFCKLGCPVGYQ
jgi:hypothetical protein